VTHIATNTSGEIATRETSRAATTSNGRAVFQSFFMMPPDRPISSTVGEYDLSFASHLAATQTVLRPRKSRREFREANLDQGCYHSNFPAALSISSCSSIRGRSALGHRGRLAISMSRKTLSVTISCTRAGESWGNVVPVGKIIFPSIGSCPSAKAKEHDERRQHRCRFAIPQHLQAAIDLK